MPIPARPTYHHGNLREALVEAGLELTRADGPRGLSVRDATRRAGVSPNAAYRHFADRDALLAAVAARIQRGVADRMQAASGAAASESPSARDALRGVGLGYIAFALAEPGWFDVAFGHADALPGEAGAGPTPPPLALLTSALDGLVTAGELSPEKRPGAEWPCWAAVHGFALLALNGPLRRLPREAVQGAAERTVDAIIEGVLSGTAAA